MSRLNDLLRHRESLGEIREIMNSMKTLAYLETRKLARYLEAQATVVANIEAVAADLLQFHPRLLPGSRTASPVCVLFGSERGFCGDFNHALLRALDDARRERDGPANDVREPVLIAVGHKLNSLLDVGQRSATQIEGASVADEVPAVLDAVVQALSALQAEHGALRVFCLFHQGDDGIAQQALLPPFSALPTPARALRYPPVVNQAPGDFLAELIDHYLFAALHAALFTSLMAENHRRIAHLDGAVKHLDDESAELTRRCNALRQEEIINEIEVILLSAASLGGSPAGDSRR